jgi:hypothetical protein
MRSMRLRSRYMRRFAGREVEDERDAPSGSSGSAFCTVNRSPFTLMPSSAMGNQMWNGFVFELQQEWDNHAAACASAGPNSSYRNATGARSVFIGDSRMRQKREAARRQRGRSTSKR